MLNLAVASVTMEFVLQEFFIPAMCEGYFYVMPGS